MSFQIQKCEELITNEDLFSVTSLTAAINQTDIVPGRIKQLGLFQEQGIPSTDLAIQYKQGIIDLVKNASRGGLAQQIGDAKRSLIKFKTTHLLQAGSLFADDFQNVRPFGAKTYENQVQDFMLEQFEGMKKNNEATIEYQRAGALVGKVLDKDGSVILDIHEEFGIKPTIDKLNLTTGDTKKQIRAIKKKAKEALKIGNVSRWIALCGSAFFDELEATPDVRESFTRFREGEVLRQDNDAIQFTSVIWEEYDAFVGGTKFVADDEAILIPVVEGLCITRFAPADYVDTVNTIGVPHYARAEPKSMNRGFDLECQSNPISLITVPDAIRRIKLTTTK